MSTRAGARRRKQKPGRWGRVSARGVGLSGKEESGEGGRRVGCPAAPAVTASTKEEFGLVAVSCALGTILSVAVAAAGRFRGLRAPGWRYRADRRRSVRHSAGAFRQAAGAPVSLRPSGPSPWSGGRCREFVARALLRKGEPERGQERRENGTPHVHRIREEPRGVPLPPGTCRAARGLPSGASSFSFPVPFRWPLPPARAGGGGAAATGGSRRPGGSGQGLHSAKGSVVMR